MTFLTDPARYAFHNGDIFLGLDKSGEIGVDLERHAITVAGSRSGKGAGLIIPNLKRWPDNVLVIDPKGENAELTYQDREAMGQAVHVLDPFSSADIPDRIRAKFNPLTSIDLTSNRARATVLDIANGLIVVHDPKHMEWVSGARSLVAGVVAYVIADAPPEHRNFASVRNILMLPKETAGEAMGLWDHAQEMANDDRIGGLIRSAGVTLITAMESEKGMEKDFLGLARRATEWLDDESISACLSDSTFHMSDLKTGNASIYLVLPSDGTFLETYGAFLRLFVKTALNAMGAEQKGKRCLFILDEFYSLGKLEELVEATGRMPSYGVLLWPFVQDLVQLKTLYQGEMWETFFSNADASIFFGNIDLTTTEYISKRIGNVTPQELNIEPPTALAEVAAKIDAGLGVRLEQAARQADYTDAMNDYNKRTKEIGTPRLPPEKVASIIGKQRGAVVASSMLAFAKGGDILHLRLAPYFQDNSYRAVPEISQKQPPLKDGHHLQEALKTQEVWKKNVEKSQAFDNRIRRIIGLTVASVLAYGAYLLA